LPKVVEHITNNLIPIIEPDDEGRGYWEIFPNRKVWHEGRKVKTNSKIDLINQELSSMPIEIKSKKQMDEERPEFTPLEHEDYELKIAGIKQNKRKKYMSQEEENVVDFELSVVGLRDGGKAKDIEGADATGRKVFFSACPDRMGFMRDGTPAKLRQLVAYATKQDVEGEMELNEWEDLAGKTLFAEIVKYTTQKGNVSNKISRFLMPKKK